MLARIAAANQGDTGIGDASGGGDGTITIACQHCEYICAIEDPICGHCDRPPRGGSDEGGN